MYVPIWVIVILLVAVLAALGGVLWERHKTRRLLERINDMLDAAMDGSFTERAFDESLLSAMENRLDKYLSASAVSARNLAQEKDKIKHLIADISHQTKTPIANILLYAQLLAEKDLPEESLPFVSALGTQAEKLSFLISSLVKLSRLETGILALNPEAAPLQPLLEAVQNEYSPEAQKAGVTLSFSPTDSTAVHDAKWSREALGNIIDNAIKYTPAGGHVTVSVTPYQMFSRIDVADDGPGIAEEELAKVFARFYRSPALSDREGVGIGLYLARQILTEQGGYIKVQSTLGKGSVFSLFLPLAL